MKNLRLIILLALMILILPGKAYAAFPETYQLGLSQAYINQRTGYPNYDETGQYFTYEYRQFPMHPKRNAKEKPTAQFAVRVNGQEKVRSDAGSNLDAPTTALDVAYNDKIEIVDLSKPYGNYKLHGWDFQYRIVPVEDYVGSHNIDNFRRKFPIQQKTLKSQGELDKYFQEVIWKEAQKLCQGRDAYIELYLQVYDNNPRDGSYAGGDNGTYACIREKDSIPPSQFEKGNTWYFTTVLLRVRLPDFFVTLKPKTDWPGRNGGACQGNAGEKVLVEARVGNKGKAAGTTDFGATWLGSKELIYYKDNIHLKPGEIVEVPFEVVAPGPGEESRMNLMTNIDFRE